MQATSDKLGFYRNITYSAKVGTGLSSSNGYFSFPSTGIYWIDFRRYGYCPNKETFTSNKCIYTFYNAGYYTTVGLGYGGTQPNSQDPSNNDHYNSHITATLMLQIHHLIKCILVFHIMEV